MSPVFWLLTPQLTNPFRTCPSTEFILKLSGEGKIGKALGVETRCGQEVFNKT